MTITTPGLTKRAFDRWTLIRDQLTHTRHAKRVNQDAVADAAGVSSRSTIGRIERGESLPGFETFLAHAHALDLEVVVVPPTIGRFLDLEVADISAIVRAAAVAVEDGLVLPTDLRRRAHVALSRLKAQPPQQAV